MKLANTQAVNSYRYGWLLNRVFPFIKPFLFRIFLGFIVAIPVGLLDGVTAFALKPYMDYVVGQKNFVWHGFVITYTLMAALIPFAVVFFAVFQGLLRYVNTYLTDWTSQKITNSVKTALFSRLVYMDTKFFDENSSGIILGRYMGDPDIASRTVVEQVKTIVTSFFGALSLIAVMLYSSWKLAVIGVVVLGIAFLPVALIRNKIKSASNKGMVIGGNITTNFNETYIGNKIMRAYGLEERQKTLFNEQIQNSFNVAMSLVKRVGWMSPLMYLIASVGIAIVLGYGTNLIISGQMTSGSFASFVTSLLLLYKPVKTLGSTLTSIQVTFVALGRVFELFDIKPELKERENAVEMPELQNNITFENVCFEYVKDVPVLKNINLEIKKGETIALVGNSGGGKSTVANLLPRFYDVNSGTIKFDDKDIRDFKIESLRNNISMVFQNNFLFSGTIKENILMGNKNATEEDLQMAIEAAHLQDMLTEMPEGIDTMLSEGGNTLSGGQRQRVAIARAMIKNSPIIVLDEATSALDNKSEHIVQKALDNLIQNKTVFLIAHRFSTIKNAHRIAVINEGEIVEVGTHNELMQYENGLYKYLYEMQFNSTDETHTSA